MEDWQKNVVFEMDELAGKVSRLKDFLRQDKFLVLGSEEKELLLEQLRGMLAYLQALQKRVEKFGEVEVFICHS